MFNMKRCFKKNICIFCPYNESEWASMLYENTGKSAKDANIYWM